MSSNIHPLFLSFIKIHKYFENYTDNEIALFSFFGSSFVPNSSLKASCIIITSRFEESLSNPLHTLRMVRGSQLSLILLQSYCKFVFEACEMILYIKSLLQRRCFTLQFQFCRLSFHNIYNSSYRHNSRLGLDTRDFPLEWCIYKKTR